MAGIACGESGISQSHQIEKQSSAVEYGGVLRKITIGRSGVCCGQRIEPVANKREFCLTVKLMNGHLLVSYG
jgi:hypothetical protein